MIEDEFYNLYSNRYIKCYDMEELTFIIKTYCVGNLDIWENKNLIYSNFIENNMYNKIGIIIMIDMNKNAYYGYYDDKIEDFIEAKKIIQKNWLNKKQEQSKKMNEITKILEKIYENQDLRSSIVPLFMSNPGIGKTAMINAFAKSKGANMIEMIASQMSPFEVSGICIPSHTKERMVYYDFDRLANLEDGDIVFLDELPNANPSVLNAMLTLIESRTMISGKKLPNILIVAAGNPQGMTPMTPQVKERFVWYDIKFEETSFIKYMIEKYDITLNIGKKLSKLIKEQDFNGETTRNFMTPRSVDKAVNMLIKQIETPYSSKILPILEEIIINSAENTIMIKEKEFLPGESLKWITIKQYNDEIIK